MREKDKNLINCTDAGNGVFILQSFTADDFYKLHIWRTWHNFILGQYCGVVGRPAGMSSMAFVKSCFRSSFLLTGLNVRACAPTRERCWLLLQLVPHPARATIWGVDQQMKPNLSQSPPLPFKYKNQS